MNQLARVLSNLTQLRHVAEDDWDDRGADLILDVIGVTEAAIRAYLLFSSTQ